MRKRKKAVRCRLRGCTNPAKARGLCLTHHKSFSRLIQRGQTSWAELERRGLATPSQRVPMLERGARP